MPVERRADDPRERTARLVCEARSILAYGQLDSSLQRPWAAADGEVFPHFVERAHGGEIVGRQRRVGFVHRGLLWLAGCSCDVRTGDSFHHDCGAGAME